MGAGGQHAQLEPGTDRVGVGLTDQLVVYRVKWPRLTSWHLLLTLQTSLGSPQTPPPALVVSGSPNITLRTSEKNIKFYPLST